MSEVFADSWFYIALIDSGDRHHEAVTSHAGQLVGGMVTTRWVLTEVANGLAAPRFRRSVARLLRDLEVDPEVRVLNPSDELYRQGLTLYDQRPNQAWSLIDCISFALPELSAVECCWSFPERR